MSAITEWTTELAQIRERVLSDRITSLDDPRAQRIIASDSYPMDDGGEVLAEYFSDEEHTLENIWFNSFTEIPECPIPLPAWADTQKVLLGEWPEPAIEYSRTVKAGGFTVQVDDMISVVTEPISWRSGETFQVGDVLDDSAPPRLAISYGGELKDFIIADLQELDILGEAILELARAIDRAPGAVRRCSAAGAPSFEEGV